MTLKDMKRMTYYSYVVLMLCSQLNKYCIHFWLLKRVDYRKKPEISLKYDNKKKTEILKSGAESAVLLEGPLLCSLPV